MMPGLHRRHLPEGHQVQMQRMPNNRMFHTMSVPHMPMGPGQQQSMYGTYDEQVSIFSRRHHLCVAICPEFSAAKIADLSCAPQYGFTIPLQCRMSTLRLLSLWLSGTLSAQGGYFLPSTSGFSTIPEVPGQPFHMSGGVTSRSLRHSASAMDLPRSGGMPVPLHEGFPMFGPGAAMGPLSNMSHFGNPRAPQVTF